MAENGTIVTVDDEVIFRATMERALGDEIICAILARDECEALVSGVEVSYLQPKTPEFTELLSTLNVKHAYNMDGGHSSTIYFNGQRINSPETKNRKVSDIIYFATLRTDNPQ